MIYLNEVKAYMRDINLVGRIDEQYHKHISDMKEMIIKFNSLKWKQPA